MSKIMLETLASVFTINDGVLKILLIKKKDDPYKGYWVLPGGIVDDDKTIEESIEDKILNQIGIKGLNFEQDSVFSSINRVPNQRIVAVSLISIADEFRIKSNRTITDFEFSWFSIDKLPKIGYDHSRVIESAISQLKTKLTHTQTIQQIFPSDFTLPELQKVYEQVLTRQLDRRNFRKKFLKLDLIEETGDMAQSMTGRPAKLYRFKNDVDNIILF